MYRMRYTDISGRSHTENSDSLGRLVDLARRMTAMELICDYAIELVEVDDSRRKRDTALLWPAVPRR